MTRPPLTGLSVLVLDDEPLLRRQLVASLERLGSDVHAVDTMAAARRLAGEETFDFALLDVNLPDGLGTDLLKERVFPTGTGVVVMTAEGGVQGAVEAMRLGALDYLTKPFEPEVLALTLGRVRRAQRQERAEEHRRQEDPGPAFFFGQALAGLEGQLQRILAADRRMQTQLPPILIQGETGTGKTSIARWLHQQGPRSTGPLIEMNCSALPENLAESELFGHEKGAFTDARSARMGLFEAAAGGSLFLDELTSLSPTLQAKLLTALEDRRIRRVGSNRDIPVDVRIIAAANQDVRALVAAGRFREDLYHRLDLYRLHLPPLRTRGEDIVRLAESLLAGIGRRHRLPGRTISATGRRRLLHYAWPGNVRELAHELERAMVFEDQQELDFDQLMGVGGTLPDPGAGMSGPGGSGGPGGRETPAGGAPDWFNPGYAFPEKGFQLEEAILRLIRHALAQSRGNVSAAARRLGVSRDYLRYRLAPGATGESGPGEAPGVGE